MPKGGGRERKKGRHRLVVIPSSDSDSDSDSDSGVDGDQHRTRGGALRGMVCEGVKQTPAKLTAEKQVPPPLKKTEVVNTLGAAGLVLAQVEGAGDCLFLSLLLQEGKITVANALRPDSATRKAVAGARTACYKMMTGTGSIEGVPAEVLWGSERLNLARNLDHFVRCGYIGNIPSVMEEHKCR